MVLADDGVAFPVANAGLRLHDGGAFVDERAVLDDAAPLLGMAAIAALSVPVTQSLAQGAAGLLSS